MRVLITGTAGRIGRVLAQGLGERHRLRGFDRVAAAAPGLAESRVGDLADGEAVREAVRGMEAVIHLGGNAGEAAWAEIQRNNFTGAYQVFEACREHGVRRIVYASRAGLLSPYPPRRRHTMDLTPRPQSLYSVSKVFGEALGWMYAAQHGLEVVCVRIGNFKPERRRPELPQHLSPGDCVRLFERAIVHPSIEGPADFPAVPFTVVFGVSASDGEPYDLAPGRAIGYEPQDRCAGPGG